MNFLSRLINNSSQIANFYGKNNYDTKITIGNEELCISKERNVLKYNEKIYDRDLFPTGNFDIKKGIIFLDEIPLKDIVKIVDGELSKKVKEGEKSKEGQKLSKKSSIKVPISKKKKVVKRRREKREDM
jgi:hypothetical protein